VKNGFSLKIQAIWSKLGLITLKIKITENIAGKGKK